MHLRVINASRQSILAIRAKVAESAHEARVGLLDRNALELGEGFIISPCAGIHTRGMHFPIDVLFVGRRSRVVLGSVTNLAPGQTTGMFSHDCMVIELPAGTVNETGTQAGDLLQFMSATHASAEEQSQIGRL